MTEIARGAAVLITDAYRTMQQKLHENPDYGTASIHYASVVADVAKAVRATELLDYGAGKGRLGQELRAKHGLQLDIHHYDPAIPEWSTPPPPRRLVACIDVLEHIEPHLLDNVLEDLKRVVLGVGVFTVHTGAAMKVLPDGRNAHLIQRPVAWWLTKFMERFELATFNRSMQEGFLVVVESKEIRTAGRG